MGLLAVSVFLYNWITSMIAVMSSPLSAQPSTHASNEFRDAGGHENNKMRAQVRSDVQLKRKVSFHKNELNVKPACDIDHLLRA